MSDLYWSCSEGEVDYGFDDVEPEGKTSGDKDQEKPTKVARPESPKAAPAKKPIKVAKKSDRNKVAGRNMLTLRKYDLHWMAGAYHRATRKGEDEKEKEKGKKEEEARK